MKNIAWLIALACTIIIFAALKAIGSIVVLVLVAIFLAILISPLLTLLEKIRINKFVSFGLFALVFVGVLTGLVALVYDAIASFTKDLPEYQLRYAKNIKEFNVWLSQYTTFQLKFALFDSVDTNKFFALVTSFLKQTSAAISNSFMVFLLVMFMLIEAQTFDDKIKYLAKTSPNTLHVTTKFVIKLKRYLAIKTISSIATGGIVYIFLLVMDVPYAALWGTSAFLLNYIPTFGSIVAAVPAIFVALVTKDVQTAGFVAVFYLVLNVLIGNFIEPKFLGDGLEISIFVVVVSLLFWGYIFGVGGMFLAVPLTMSVKLALQANPRTRFLAVLLSNKAE